MGPNNECASRRGAALLAVTSCESKGDAQDNTNTLDSQASVAAASSSTEASTTGECPPFRVYAQDDANPQGVAIRSRPDNDPATKIGGYNKNTEIWVNGWFESGKPLYPNNPVPWNSDVYFRISGPGTESWVAFAGVRARQRHLSDDPKKPMPPADKSEACKITMPK